jgi:Ca2+:H+ antiporter
MKVAGFRIRTLWIFLLFVPLSIVLELAHAPATWVFAAAALAIIPLAGIMGEATEQLAARAGAGLGGLLNATFGNAAELIIALMALRQGLVDIVKASLTGSIIGNSLLVLGASLLAGGLRHRRQTFNTTAAGMGATLLVLSVIGLVVPAVYHSFTHDVRAEALHPQALSLAISIVLFVTYLLSLVFSLRTHQHLFAGHGHAKAPKEAAWAQRRSIITLLVTTAIVAVESEFLVGAVQATAAKLGFTEVFVGVIIVAVIGNAAEHSTAILVALKNEMDLALNIAIGSSIQVALFLAPVLVFASYAFGRPMDLVFTPFEVLAVGMSTLVLNFVAQDGESHWMEGVLLLAVYVVFGIAFYYLPG